MAAGDSSERKVLLGRVPGGAGCQPELTAGRSQSLTLGWEAAAPTSGERCSRRTHRARKMQDAEAVNGNADANPGPSIRMTEPVRAVCHELMQWAQSLARALLMSVGFAALVAGCARTGLWAEGGDDFGDDAPAQPDPPDADATAPPTPIPTSSAPSCVPIQKRGTVWTTTATARSTTSPRSLVPAVDRSIASRGAGALAPPVARFAYPAASGFVSTRSASFGVWRSAVAMVRGSAPAASIGRRPRATISRATRRTRPSSSSAASTTATAARTSTISMGMGIETNLFGRCWR